MKITIDKAVVEQALDALEYIENVHCSENVVQDAYTALRSALNEASKEVEHGSAPAGATHYQPHQKTYYKRVSATEWYLWSCTGRGWVESKGTGDSADWVTLNPLPSQASKEVEQLHDYRIRYDRACYKCRSNFCPGNCEEPKHLSSAPAVEKVEPVAWMMQHNGECMGFLPYEEIGTVPVFTHPAPAVSKEVEPVADPLYKALASAWYYGNWKAETSNERHMQALMEKAGWWPITEEQLFNHAPAVPEFRCPYCKHEQPYAEIRCHNCAATYTIDAAPEMKK